MKKILVTLLLLPYVLLAQTTNLFISEYGEGSGGNKKYLEIYNGTGATVDLANFQIWKGVNGAAWGAPLVLTGSLLNGGTYVIGNNNVDVIGADMYSTYMNYNGDDAMGLAWNGGSGTIFTLLDVFGIEGVDPGTSWTIAGNVNGSVDKILIRKPTVCSPSTDWTAIAGVDAASSQYTIAVDPYNATTQTTDLGIHTSSCVATCNTFYSFSVTVCTSYTVPSGDETYFASGIYMDTIPNAALCDSILTIDLTITSGITYYADVDTDGLGDPNNTTVACVQPVGYVTNGNDCDDNNIAIGAATITYYEDFDNDTYGSTTVSVVACSQPVGYVTNNLDCNDTDNTINPGAVDIPDNGIDEDCSGSDASLAGIQIGIYEFTQAAACPVTALSVTAQPANAVFSDYSTSGTSCSSAANVFSNSGWNLTAGIDLAEYNEFSIASDDCYIMDLNKLIFTHRISASGGTPTWTLRSSLDNFTSDLASGTPLTTDKTDTVILSAAFDAVTSVTFRFYITNMGASGSTWRNDNVRLIGTFGTTTPQTFYADTDGDTYGDPSSTLIVCNPPVGYVLNNTDCDDTDAAINPATIWYEDLDNDTYGNDNVTFTGCTPPANYVLTGGDCDDTDNTLYTETMYYTDADGDGFGSSAPGTLYCSDPGVGYSLSNIDCNDLNSNLYPGATEICDGLDNNCNSSIDEGLTFTSYYIDADNDNFGTGVAQSFCSNPGAGFSLFDGDCNDNNSSVYPGATEILDNGIDENCDGTDNYLGINENSSVLISIYPNPSNGSFTINFNTTVAGTITVTDLNGKVLLEEAVNNETLNLDLSALANGNYILKITTEFGVNQQRIVVQK